MIYHKPVLLAESIKGLNIKPDGIYVDVTFGGGGHSKAILQKLSLKGRLLALDQDEDAQQNLISDDRFQFICGNFSHLKRHLKFCGITSVNGILADFGVSSHQIDSGLRGFSTRLDGPLDMRMNTKSELSAYNVVNLYSEEELQKIFKNYGELRNARKLAGHIVKERIQNRYRFLNTLGEGTFGKVKVACLISNPSKKYAVKSIPRDMVD